MSDCERCDRLQAELDQSYHDWKALRQHMGCDGSDVPQLCASWDRLQAEVERLSSDNLIHEEIKYLRQQLADQRAAITQNEIKLRAADVVMKRLDEMIARGDIDARNAVADARLDYGDPFKYEAKQRAAMDGLVGALRALMTISHKRKLDEALTWRENDDAVQAMCNAALDAVKEKP